MYLYVHTIYCLSGPSTTCVTPPLLYTRGAESEKIFAQVTDGMCSCVMVFLPISLT